MSETDDDDTLNELDAEFRALLHAPPVDPDELLERVQPSRIAPGTRIDHAFVVERRIARGGMGVVYLAQQELLQRPVAIKLCRRRASRAQTDRLLKEARAMAALDHPNVVAVHHVGVFDDQVYIAMEYVEGGTLRAWCAERPRSTSELLTAFVAAGRGLEAAHARGFVHRDFKPDNVLIGLDGRARVTDFGLVSEEQPSLPGHGDDETLGHSSWGAGTPRYMAPEQRTEARVGPAADQYSLCLCLQEALETSARRQRASGKRGARVPRRVRSALQRGLQADPAARYPDLASLLRALEPRRRRWSWFGAGGVIVALGTASVVTWLASTPTAAECPSASDRVVEVWNAARAGAVSTAVAPIVDGDRNAQRLLTGGFERFASRWEGAYAMTCETESLPTVELQTAARSCLDEALAQFDETLAILTDPGTRGELRVMEAQYSLPTLRGCLDVATLQRRLATPRSAEQAHLLEALRIELARIRAASLVNVVEPDLRRIDVAVATARGLGDRSALATALLLRARSASHDRLGGRRAVDWLEQAYVEAEKVGDDRLRAEIGADIVYFVGVDEGRRAEALARASRTLAVVARLGELGDAEAGALHDSIGRVHLEHGQLGEATESLLRAEALKASALGPDHPMLADLRLALGRLLLRRRQFDHAREMLEAADAGFRRATGPQNPGLAHVTLVLSELAEERSDDHEAQSLLHRVLLRWEAEFGPEHPRLVLPLNGLGRVLSRIGEHDQAMTAYARAREIAVRSMGPDDVQTGWALVNEAEGLLAAGAFEQAALGFSSAVDHMRAQPSPIDGLDNEALAGRAQALLATGRVRDAYDDARHVAHSCRERACEPAIVARAALAEARALTAWGRSVAAEDIVRQALAQLPNERRTHRLLRSTLQSWLDRRPLATLE